MFIQLKLGAGFRGIKSHAHSRRQRYSHGNSFTQASDAPQAAGSLAPSQQLSALHNPKQPPLKAAWGGRVCTKQSVSL